MTKQQTSLDIKSGAKLLWRSLLVKNGVTDGKTLYDWFFLKEISFGSILIEGTRRNN